MKSALAAPRPRRWPFWCLSAALIVAGPVLTDIYWGQVMASGALPTTADSIGIPVLMRVLANLAAAPVVLGLTGLALWRCERWGGWLAWRKGRPWLNLAVSLPLGGAAAWLGAITLADALAPGGAPVPRYGQIQYLDPVLMLAWLLAMRGLLLSPRISR